MSELVPAVGDSLRETLEKVAGDSIPDSETVPMAPLPETPPVVPEQQTPESGASSPSKDVAEPAAGKPSTEGSAATEFKPEEGKSIKDVVTEEVDASQHPDATSVETKTPETEKPAEPTKPIDTAPASWKGEAKKVWADLPEIAREEFQRREKETAQIVHENLGNKKKVQEMGNILQPFASVINNNYEGNPLNAVQNLLSFERNMTSSNKQTRAEMTARLIKQFDVDLPTLDAILSNTDVPPEVKQQSQVEQLVEQRMAPVNQFLAAQQKQQQEAQQAQAAQFDQSVQAMAADAKYPNFNAIRDDMADVIEMGAKRGVEVSLEQAYNKASLMNNLPTAVENNQGPGPNSAENETQRALKAHNEAQAAKNASVSVSGNPASVNGVVPVNTDLRSLISSALEGGSNRV